ncbi:hypothetical protein CORTU0001_1192 [Corynebacterium tuberculostearicum SK141]|uniref:Uncharacterized protein n=1 Tax=Corynebacterium tuberculostearicum SK141 TaxID=553206 RepID=C6R6Q4_9CORY|nr:hypothetical protein CORTU0001_1192 [Corynebacterium tuberculostearicum SK141]
MKHKGQSSHVASSNWWFKGDNVAESWVPTQRGRGKDVT